VAAEIQDMFVGRVLAGAAATCDEEGYHLLLANSRLDGRVESRVFERLARDAAARLVIPVGTGRNEGHEDTSVERMREPEAPDITQWTGDV
jgi:DNA-binding LacI/PurR family transcriptional regulator